LDGGAHSLLLLWFFARETIFDTLKDTTEGVAGDTERYGDEWGASG